MRFCVGLILLLAVDPIVAVWFWEHLIVDRFVGGRVWDRWMAKFGGRGSEQLTYVQLQPRGEGGHSGLTTLRPSFEDGKKVEIVVGEDGGDGDEEGS